MCSIADIPIVAAVFAHPFWLVGLVAACAPVWLASVARRRGRQIPRAGIVLKCVAIAALAFALARPSIQVPQSAARKWLILSDVSASVRTQNIADELPEEIAPRLDYHFAASVAPVGQAIGDEQTNLAAALRLATARVDELAGVVLMSDGNFTDSDWSPAAEALGRSGATLAIVAMDRPPRDVRIAEFTAVRLDGQRVALGVSAIANAMAQTVIEIPGVLKREIKLLPYEPVTISIDTEVPLDRGASFTARLTQPDAFSENNVASASVGPVVRRAALIGTYQTTALAPLLGMPIDALAPQRVGDALNNYAVLLLVDDTGRLLGDEQRKAVAAFVRNGGGLVLLGAGPHQSPADRQDPLNQAAALVPNPYDRKPIALTVALDASGSMGQKAARAGGHLVKFDQAAEAVLSLKRHLTDRDALRVIVFSDRAKELYDSGAGRPDFAKLASALRQVKPTGATKVFPAMELAAAAPPDAKRQGLLIIVSDLQTEKFDPPKAADMLKNAKLDLAIVAIASPAATPSTQPLETLKKLLDAPLEKRDQLVGLARIFAGFLNTTRGRAVRRGQFTISAADTSPLADQAVGAYIASAPHADSDVILRVGGDAVLARRTVGMGRSVSIALPVSDPGASELLNNRTFAGVLASSMEWSARAEPDSRFSGQIVRSGPRAIVNIRAVDASGVPINMLELFVRTLGAAEGSADKAPMEQVAPGRYAAQIDIELIAGGCDIVDSAGTVVWRGGASRTYRREFDAIGPNYDNLRSLASLSGGQLVQVNELAEIARGGRHSSAWELWPWLAGLALALMLLDWLGSRTILKNKAIGADRI